MKWIRKKLEKSCNRLSAALHTVWRSISRPAFKLLYEFLAIIPMPDGGGRRAFYSTSYTREVFVLLQAAPWIILLRPGGLIDRTETRVASAALVLYLILTAAVWSKVPRASFAGHRLRLFLLIACGLNMFIGAFTGVYWHLSQADAQCFNQEITRWDATYFTLTTFTTTGYGDILAESQACRRFVVAQMASGAFIVSGVLAVVISGYTARPGARR